jgi:trans-aconitate methyltransferase
VTKHGWFIIPSVQNGERDLKERIKPLGTVLANASGATVADFGCAEGLIGKWLIDHGGAAALHGFDKHEPYLETAREIMKGYPAQFEVCDLDEFDAWRASRPALPRFKIVLAMNVLHKLARPRDVLCALADLCDDMLVLALPGLVIKDRRSGMKPIDPREVLAPNFTLLETHNGIVHSSKGHLGIRTIYRRRQG